MYCKSNSRRPNTILCINSLCRYFFVTLKVTGSGTIVFTLVGDVNVSAYVEALTLNDTVEVPPPNERVTVLLPVVVAVRETVNVPPDAVAEAGPESPELYDRLTEPA